STARPSVAARGERSTAALARNAHGVAVSASPQHRALWLPRGLVRLHDARGGEGARGDRASARRAWARPQRPARTPGDVALHLRPIPEPTRVPGGRRFPRARGVESPAPVASLGGGAR